MENNQQGPIGNKSYTRITPTLKAEIRKLRDEGFSYTQVAELVSVSQSSVKRHLRPDQRGVPNVTGRGPIHPPRPAHSENQSSTNESDDDLTLAATFEGIAEQLRRTADAVDKYAAETRMMEITDEALSQLSRVNDRLGAALDEKEKLRGQLIERAGVVYSR